ncbi:hypothetical protein Glove_13g40 [Diversispora epigaea]|uniref:Uncharacterized protein n=1 Tax=Diversispora epigaea TaxID=1348612 RepID=A0A397JNQ2_9GLOM|nr:hypothetical protein Glove_13g40 [Diversispora epigaea]
MSHDRHGEDNNKSNFEFFNEEFLQVIGEDSKNKLTPCHWQIDKDIVNQVNNDSSILGVCMPQAFENAYRPLFICGKCFINNGGHLYIKPGKGKKPTNCDEQHVNDSSEQLKMIDQWLIIIGKSNENKLQNLTLFTIAPSIFKILENTSLKKCSSVQQTSTTPDIDYLFSVLTKIGSLFLSILISITFPSIKVWFSQVLTSLTRKPKIAIKKRMNNANPRKRLQQNPNIWNLAVIDNIDLKQKTFTYGNIFDTTRETSHTTIRMATELPNSN